MKKLSSMLALGLALALTFGMTVSAKESVTTEGTAPVMKEEQKQEYTAKAEAQAAATTVTTTVGGVEVTLDKGAVQPETLLEAENVAADKVKANAAALGISIPANATVTTSVVGSADVALPAGIEMPEAGIQLSIEIGGIKAGKNYVLLHLTAEGKWETIKPDAVVDGKVTATFKSLSPVVANEVIVVVGEEVSGEAWPEPRHPENAAAAAAAASPATSPKTAETLPVAGVMALICLAGAAVCANKIRYNK